MKVYYATERGSVEVFRTIKEYRNEIGNEEVNSLTAYGKKGLAEFEKFYALTDYSPNYKNAYNALNELALNEIN